MNRKLSSGRTPGQQRIVDAVRKIITSKGIESLTIREIAKELKMTDGALYRHFKSKKEIIGLLINDIENTLLSTIEEAANKPSNPLKKLENILASHLSYAEQRKGLTFVVINETLIIKDKNLRKKMFTVIERYLETIKEILSEGVKSGEFRKGLDLISASRTFFGMVQSTVTLLALS